jgi:hypothetical protein
MANTWPEVVLGGAHTPYIDRILDEEPYITRPKTVVAYGTVEAYPWSLVVYEKHGDPEDEADEGSPMSDRRWEFFLGGSLGLPGSQPGGFGGGGGHISLLDAAPIDTTAHSWATTPPVMGYVIFASDAVGQIEVRPELTEPRRFDVQQAPQGLPNFCVFFPPFAAPGKILALGERGAVLYRRDLYSGPIPAGATFAGGD